MELTTRFTEAYGLSTPIAQAGMAFVVPADTAQLPVVGPVDLGGQRMELHRSSNFVPMRDLTTGDLEEMPLLAGQGVGLVDSIQPAATVLAEMTAQARAMLDRHRAGVLR